MGTCLCATCAPDWVDHCPPTVPQPDPPPALTNATAMAKKTTIVEMHVQMTQQPTQLPFPTNGALPWGMPFPPPFPPSFFFMPPFPMPQLPTIQPQACCLKYTQWLTHKVGRPPHDFHCQRKQKQIGR